MATAQEIRRPQFLSIALCIAAGRLTPIPVFVVLSGWHSHSNTLVQTHPALLPTQYNAARKSTPCSPGLTPTLSGPVASKPARSSQRVHSLGEGSP